MDDSLTYLVAGFVSEVTEELALVASCVEFVKLEESVALVASELRSDDVQLVVVYWPHAVLVVFNIMCDAFVLGVVPVGTRKREDRVEGIGILEGTRQRFDGGERGWATSLGVRQH